MDVLPVLSRHRSIRIDSESGFRNRRTGSVSVLSFLILQACLIGCEGRTVISDNAVFSDLPPRRSLVNSASRQPDGPDSSGTILLASSSRSLDLLRGNTVVAEVNGQPIFVDDVAGSLRASLEAAEELTDEQRQAILKQEIEKNLDQRVREEAILQALHLKIPEEQRDKLQEHLSEAFEDSYLPLIQEKTGTHSREELEAALAAQGLTIEQLREAFIRIQMVNGYVESRAEQYTGPEPGRPELLQYYREHIDDFTPQERIRWQELKISRRKHGDQEAKRRMADVLRKLKSGEAEFDELARRYSDSFSAEKNGNRGWLTRGELADSRLEETLFSLKSGEMTSVIESDDYFAVYRVARHEYAKPRPFELVQDEIRESIQKARQEQARERVIEDVVSKACCRTIFDDGRTR